MTDRYIKIDQTCCNGNCDQGRRCQKRQTDASGIVIGVILGLAAWCALLVAAWMRGLV